MYQSKLSIVIPLYNREDLIKETLESLFLQTYRNFECLIIDDHSTDRSLEVATQMTQDDDRFIVQKRKSTGKGAPVCRNEGINLASGDYIMFLDSDDLMDPQCIEQRFRLMKDVPNMDFYVFPLAYFNHSSYVADQLCSDISGDNDIKAFLTYTGGWQASSTVFRSGFLKENLRFDEEALSWQDVEFHLRAIAKTNKYHKFHNASPDVYVRLTDAGRITSASWKFDKIASRIKLYSRVEKLLDDPQLEKYFFTLSFKYLEIGARTLPASEYKELKNLWSAAHSSGKVSSGWKLRYLDLQNFLSRNKMYYFGSFLFRAVRKVPGANITIPLKRKKLKEAIDVRKRLSAFS